MSEVNNPQGNDLHSAQNAIRQLLTPEEDNVTEPNALEAEETQEEVVEEAEMPEEEVSLEEAEPEGELEVEEEAEELEDQSFDILAHTVEVDGEEITVEELRRGNLRQRDYTRKTQELADAKRNMQAQFEEVERERAQYAQLLPALEERLNQPAEQEPDWDKLYDTDPVMAAKAERQWNKQKEERKGQLDAVRQEQERMSRINEERNAQMHARYVDEQRQILPDLIPEWRDTKVAKKEATELRDFLINEGFTEEDVSGLANASLVKLARKAMLYDRGQTRAIKAKTKPKPKSKTLRTGSRNSQPKPKAAQTQALQRVKQTGRVQDAAAAINTLLSNRRP